MATDRLILAAASTRSRLRWLALGAIVGPVGFTLAWLVLGFVSPGFTQWGVTIAPYSPISAPISGLGLGPTGPFMNAAFVANGVLLLVGLVGIGSALEGLGRAARWTCLIALAVLPLASIGNGIFTLESGGAHFVVALVGLGSPVLCFMVAGLMLRRLQDWRQLGSALIVASALTLVLVIVFYATFTPTAEGARTGVAGLTERIVIVEVLAWYVALGWHALKAVPSAPTRTRTPDRRRPRGGTTAA